MSKNQWQNDLANFMRDKGRFRVNGKVASERSQDLTKSVISSSFQTLHRLGYRVERLANLREKHVEVLVRYWWFEQKKQIKTISNDLSRLRVVCEMIGKRGMVKNVTHYLPEVPQQDLVVTQATKHSKTPVYQGIDMIEILKKADERDWRFGLMFRMAMHFGLRREELVKCNPHIQDHGKWLEVLPGQGKGGRGRSIVIANEAQRKVLDMVKQHVRKGEKLGWPFTRDGQVATLKQNLRRYNGDMEAIGFTKKQFGVTGHSLRALFAENNALTSGVLPPSLGGEKKQHDTAEMKIREAKIAQSMGHNRRQIMSSYYGRFSNKNTRDAADFAKTVIITAVESLQDALPTVPDERLEDCSRILVELQLLDLDLTLRQAHALWMKWSHRSGVEWIRPDKEIILCLVAVSQNNVGGL